MTYSIKYRTSNKKSGRMPGPAEINSNNQAQITMSDLLVEKRVCETH